MTPIEQPKLLLTDNDLEDTIITDERQPMTPTTYDPLAVTKGSVCDRHGEILQSMTTACVKIDLIEKTNDKDHAEIKQSLKDLATKLDFMAVSNGIQNEKINKLEGQEEKPKGKRQVVVNLWHLIIFSIVIIGAAQGVNILKIVEALKK